MENYKFRRNHSKDRRKAFIGVVLFLTIIAAYAAHEEGILFNNKAKQEIVEQKPRA